MQECVYAESPCLGCVMPALLDLPSPQATHGSAALDACLHSDVDDLMHWCMDAVGSTTEREWGCSITFVMRFWHGSAF